ncbi:MAG: MFS transporter [marine bacterium B5-7]|nr:MAG: MFS transporter [marine bacterium B5-7]
MRINWHNPHLHRISIVQGPLKVFDTFKSVSSLLASYWLLMMANGLLSTLLAVRTDIESFSIFITGLVMSSYFVGLLLGALYSAYLVIRVGHIRAFAVYASVMSTASILHVLLVEPAVWMVVRALAGFCMAGMILITEAWLNERADNRVRGVLLATYMAIGYFGSGLGQFILPLADPAKFTLFGLVSVLLSLALIPVLITRAPSPRPVTPQRVSPIEVYKISPVATIGTVISGMLASSLYGLGPLFARQIGLSLTETSTFMACAILGGLVLQIPLGRVSDRFDRRKVLAVSVFATSAACVGVILSASVGNIWQQASGMVSSTWLFVTAAVYGSLAFTLYSQCAAQANDVTPHDKLIQTAGGLLVAYGIGAIIGPLLGGFIMEHTGPRSLFVYLMVLSFSLGLYTLHRMRVRVPGTRKLKFIPKPEAMYSHETLYNSVQNEIDRNLARAAGGRGPNHSRFDPRI